MGGNQNVADQIDRFSIVMAEEVQQPQRHHVDGFICGHIHHATIHDSFGIRYVNCGDWVESCTAVAEHADGRLEIITWTGEGDAAWPGVVPDDASLEGQTGMAATVHA